MENETVKTELNAQRQRYHDALERKNMALSQIDEADKVILESLSVIRALEFSLQDRAEASPWETKDESGARPA